MVKPKSLGAQNRPNQEDSKRSGFFGSLSQRFFVPDAEALEASGMQRVKKIGIENIPVHVSQLFSAKLSSVMRVLCRDGITHCI